MATIDIPGVSSTGFDELQTPMEVTEHEWKPDVSPRVTICCIAFNQERFIRQAIDGFLRQKTTFPVEILVHDDASTDGTSEIIREYQERYPFLIKGIYQSENQFSLGKRPGIDIRKFAKGEFLALCEGDDFWVSDSKLQRQVEYLDSHPKCVLVGGRVFIWQDGAPTPYRIDPPCPPSVAACYTTCDFFIGAAWLHTATRVFRRSFIERFPLDVPDPESQFDLGQVLYTVAHADAGQVEIGFIDEVLAVYRKHSGGIYTSAPRESSVRSELHIRKTVLPLFRAGKGREILLKSIQDLQIELSSVTDSSGHTKAEVHRSLVTRAIRKLGRHLSRFRE